MCCSMRATVFFLSSMHIWFAVTHLVIAFPTVLASLTDRTLEAVLAVFYSVAFFTVGFILLRGTDQESPGLVGAGAIGLLLVVGERYVVMWLGLLLLESLPEGDFLNPYGTTVPVIFTVLLYIFYLAILFCYHNELRYETSCIASCSGSSSRPRLTHSDTPPRT